MPEPGRWNADVSWRQRVKSIARSVGVEVSRWRSSERRLREFLERHSIEVVVDAGASGGQFGRALRKAGFTGRIISFEPLSEPFDVLRANAANDPLWDVHRLALGDEKGRRRMNLSADTTSSSFLDRGRPELVMAEARYVGREDVFVERLDDVLADLGVAEGRVLLKLDVQGYQLPVIRGGEATLARVMAVQCELSVQPLYDGEPAFLELLLELNARGFELEELEPGFYDPTSGRVLQFDGRFVSTPSNGARAAAAKRSVVCSSAKSASVDA
jgi:FkbM family methyltransferase